MSRRKLRLADVDVTPASSSGSSRVYASVAAGTCAKLTRLPHRSSGKVEEVPEFSNTPSIPAPAVAKLKVLIVKEYHVSACS